MVMTRPLNGESDVPALLVGVVRFCLPDDYRMA